MTKKEKTKTSAAVKKAGKNKSARSSKPLKRRQKSRKPAAPETRVKSKAVKTAAPKGKAKKPTLRDIFRGKKLQDIRKKLLKQRELLLAEAKAALNVLPGQTIFPDMGDQATAETDRNFMLRLRSREQKLLKKIDDAIDRIDKGTFGICEDCGTKIDIRRLVARPVTTLCMECKTQQEEEERMRES
ncbi:MAG: RNA polymerase-binding protein DksA [Nitrospirae bacterium CG_4_10_14_3_um_filter_44_29]|nr:RNA polymerase-binding protein DksA [Nitrospirota bacterium]PIP69710.1 MAG: RNA polymerase-binding protein DksA [Nitrospirae bacterium CG22_combo_CG10-13_8_21_14_all_44_11]PIV40121.1 MAG: RNA polymerase-binding protein DksA [Nitrospirae bacterium CG02_land_8_20_14_3_00_44_33]PIV66997.1 MAG: RNA polymerase-binding protein DksA [Nitrospirae bacterium CG01_land_8_20_14_3_00_44_22]PIW89383.1 MAG: RNA polymerase-binding protein DksA [Nitrospirae bacterium CG_4_8_14_3_um_filter_44_28]PIX89040.1 M